MVRDGVDLKDRVFDLMEVSPLDKEFLYLKSANLSDSEIAEKTVFTEEQIEERKDKHLKTIEALNLEYVRDLSRLSWRQVQEFNSFELSELSAVAERVLSYDNRVVSSSEMSEVVNEAFDHELNATETGKKLRMLGEEVLEEDDYLNIYVREGVRNQWQIGYLRDNYSGELLEIIDENKSRSDYKFDIDGKEETDTTEDTVVNSKDYELPIDINEKSAEELYNFVVDENPDLENLNKALESEFSKTVFQVSKITENAGGWAPEAVNPFKVDVNNEEVYGKRAILKVRGATTPYKIEKIIDEELD